jgi:type IV secretory pathway VirB2 component (pilin)
MGKPLLETLACAIVICIFYGIVWWLLGSYFFGLTNLILISAVTIFAAADICAIHYLIRRRRKKSQ